MCKWLKVIEAELRVTLALDVTVTVDVPCVNVPTRVMSGLVVPVKVTLDAFAVNVPPVATSILPVVKGKLLAVVVKLEVADVVRVMVVVAATTVVDAKLTVKACAVPAVGLILSMPLMVSELEPNV